MSDVPDDIEGLFAVPHDPKLDEALENWSPMMHLIADVYAKAVACGVPPGLAERLCFEYFRGVAAPLFNTPHPVIAVVSLSGITFPGAS